MPVIMGSKAYIWDRQYFLHHLPLELQGVPKKYDLKSPWTIIATDSDFKAGQECTFSRQPGDFYGQSSLPKKFLEPVL